MSRPLDLVFMGTPDFAVGPLEALVRAGHRIRLVVTQPDRPAGRGARVREPAVKAWARELGLEVAQPKRLRGPKGETIRARLSRLRPEAIVVAAYGQILPPEILEIPRLGCLNVHASLLPRWRGAAPIQAAIRHGDAETGITIMQMDAGLDTGPMLLQRALPIGAEATAGDLHDLLRDLGAELIVEALEGLAAGALGPRPQPAEGVTHAPMLRKEDGRIDWALAPRPLLDHIRAMTPWPGAQASLGGRPLRVLRARAAAPAEVAGVPLEPGAAGAILARRGSGALVRCGEGGLLRVERIQPAGRRAMAFSSYLDGRRLKLPLFFDPAGASRA